MSNIYLRQFIKVLVITAITFFLTKVIVFIPLNFSIFSSESIQKIDQFDIYSELIEKSGIKPFDNRIVVVTVPQDGGRWVLTEALNTLSEYHPAAIAVDVYLKGSIDPDIDEMLIDAIRSNRNVVFPAIYNGNTIVNDSSLFDINNIEINKGFINIQTERSPYKHYFKTSVDDDYKTIYPLSLEAVRIAHPEYIKKLLERNNDKELINFKMDIPCISYTDIYSMADMITGRIVILGASSNTNKSHNTYQRMPDYMVQAHIASTVMHECYIDKPSRLLNAIFSVFIIIVFIYFNLILATKLTKVSAFFIRLLTYSLFFAMVIIPFMLFTNYSYYFDCGQLLLAILFAPWAQDIYNLFDIIRNNCYTIIKKHINKRNKTKES